MNTVVRSNHNLSLIKAIEILRQFTLQRPQLGVTELVQISGLPKSVVHRIVQTLETTGFLEQDPQSQKYHVGLLAYEVGSLYMKGRRFDKVLEEELENCAQESTHTCNFGIIQGLDAIVLAVAHGSSPIRIIGQPGDRLPAHCTAIGKALLASYPPSSLEEYLAHELAGMTPKTVTNPTVLRTQLERTREVGYSVSVEESYLGVCAVGCVISDLAGTQVGAISASIPVFEFTPEREAELAALTRNYAERISRRMPTGRSG